MEFLKITWLLKLRTRYMHILKLVSFFTKQVSYIPLSWTWICSLCRCVRYTVVNCFPLEIKSNNQVMKTQQYYWQCHSMHSPPPHPHPLTVGPSPNVGGAGEFWDNQKNWGGLPFLVFGGELTVVGGWILGGGGTKMLMHIYLSS